MSHGRQLLITELIHVSRRKYLRLNPTSGDVRENCGTWAALSSWSYTTQLHSAWVQLSVLSGMILELNAFHMEFKKILSPQIIHF